MPLRWPPKWASSPPSDWPRRPAPRRPPPCATGGSAGAAPRIPRSITMPWFAISIQGEIEKYGAYVGIAAFFGLAVLSLLYFAQARELRRLRDWAGRSPEFEWDELERRVLSLESRRAAPQRAAAPVPVPAMAATNGAHKLKPEQVAALAFARAAGVAHPPHPPKPGVAGPASAPQPTAVAVQDPPQTAVETVPPDAAPEPAPVTGNGNGSGH